MRTMEKKEERETLAEEHTYIAIDLKSFYASVECVERSLNPLTTNLVVADVSRTEKTICLAVSPSLKAYGIPGRARLFEVVQKVREVNAVRRSRAPGGKLAGESCFVDELQRRPELALSYIAAVPRMAHYMEYSAKIYRIYLKYIAPEDIHVYSIDEIFADVSSYLKGAGGDDHPGYPYTDRHHGHGGHRIKSVSVQSGTGYRGKTGKTG